MGKQLILAVASCVLIASCTTTRTITVEPPKVDMPTRPHLALEDIQPGATHQDKDKAIASSVYSLMGYAKQLEELLKPFVKKGEQDK